MSILAVQEPTIAIVDSQPAATKAFGSNVTAGNLVTIVCGRYDNGSDTPFVVGDCTKNAGTATLGAITLDKQLNIASGNPVQVGVWSVPVTGSGSLTMQVAGDAGSYFEMVIGEYSGTDVTGSRVEDSDSNPSLTAVSPGTTGTGTSAGEALFLAGLVIDYSGPDVNPGIGNGFTQTGESPDGSAHQPGAAGRRIVGSGTTTEGTWTLDTGGLFAWAGALVVYKAASGGGGSPQNVTAAAAGVATVSVARGKLRGMTKGTSAGVATTTATAKRWRGIALGTVAGLASVSATAHAKRANTASASGQATTSVTCTKVGGSQKNATTASAGIATASADAHAKRKITTAAAGSDTVTVSANVIRAAAAAPAGHASVAVTCSKLTAGSTASASGAATTSATLHAKRALSVTSSGRTTTMSTANARYVMHVEADGGATITVTPARTAAVPVGRYRAQHKRATPQFVGQAADDFHHCDP